MKKLVSILAVLFITVSAMAQITSAMGESRNYQVFPHGYMQAPKVYEGRGGNVSVSNVEFQRIKL